MEKYPAKVAVAVKKLEHVISLFEKGEVSLEEFNSNTTISHGDFLDEDNETFQTTTVSITFKS